MDILHRFSFADLPIRGQWVRLEKALGLTTVQRDYPYALQSLLNEMLAAVAMVADNLKFDGAVALQSRGSGVLRRSLAECRNQGLLRGIMHLDEEQAE